MGVLQKLFSAFLAPLTFSKIYNLCSLARLHSQAVFMKGEILADSLPKAHKTAERLIKNHLRGPDEVQMEEGDEGKFKKGKTDEEITVFGTVAEI